ncbi:hypothetical protein CMO93_05840 [Candidatus Woesearchaeota archaeon]|nr:hypothetical protein [Candidatus Woesearchaeota archaeon]|tara:strand:+ start:5130 stop:6311 length:1182 start_codon:yes stop_codon:yes gene_type:complete
MVFFKKKKPNIIMIKIDAVRCDALDKTSFYQELKKKSIFFSNLITYAPYSIGSLHSTFSGMYGNQNGVNGYYKSFSFDKENCFTLTQYLKEQGYYTEADWLNRNIAPQQGFDKIRVYDEHKDDVLKRHTQVLNQIKTKEPFFLSLDHVAVHTELVTNVLKKYDDFSEEYFNDKDNNFKRYLEWVKQSGVYLKAVLEKIKELGLWENSIILIFSDHGTSVGDKIGEKAYGVYLYDYSLRCFLYLIGKDFPKNLHINSLVRTIDILPTILEILKIKEKENYKKIHGKSFLPFIYGKEEERIAYSETGGLGGPTPSPEIHNVQGVRTNKWKLIYNKENKKKELYDLERDPNEENNVIGEHKDIEEKLFREIEVMGKKYSEKTESNDPSHIKLKAEN